jgi:hypothetical protein
MGIRPFFYHFPKTTTERFAATGTISGKLEVSIGRKTSKLQLTVFVKTGKLQLYTLG